MIGAELWTRLIFFLELYTHYTLFAEFNLAGQKDTQILLKLVYNDKEPAEVKLI